MQKETERNNNNNNNKEENHVHLRLFPQRIRQRIFGRFHCRVYVAWSLFSLRLGKFYTWLTRRQQQLNSQKSLRQFPLIKKVTSQKQNALLYELKENYPKNKKK